MQQQHLCGTKTNLKVYQIVSFVSYPTMRCWWQSVFLNLPRETNRLLASRLLLQSVVQQSEIFSGSATLFENYSKCRIWIFSFWHFPPIFLPLKLTCLVTLFDRKLQVFKNLPFTKCKRSSLRSQSWMRLFLWFSNTVTVSDASR